MTSTMQHNSSTYCISLAPKINSKGIWNETKNPILNYSLPLLQLQMFVVSALTGAIYFVLKRIGIHKLVSQMIAGVILSPVLLGRPLEGLSNIVFPRESQNLIGTIGMLGYTLFIFVSGVKIDIGMVYNAGRKAFVIGIFSVIIPLFIGMTAQHNLVEHMLLSAEEEFKITFLTATQATTSFVVVANLLEELKIINSELGRLGLSSAVVCDLFSFTIRYLMLAVKLGKDVSVTMAAINVALNIGFCFFLFFVIRPTFFWVIKQTPEGRPVKGIYIYTILMMAFGSGVITHLLGQYVPLGPFIFGLMIPDGSPLGSAFVEKLDCFTSGVLLPFFATTATMKADLRIYNGKLVTVSAILILVVLMAKIVACLIPTIYCKMPLKDAFSIALIMSCKGIIELTGYTAFTDNKIFSEDIFSTTVISLIIIASAVQLLVKYLYDPSRKYAAYQKRNIMHTKNGDLRILACIYRAYNIPAIINLLDASNPTNEDPFSVNVLHLVEMTARMSPIFISHQLQKKSISNRSYSQNVILSFSEYERVNQDCVKVNAFTAISPPHLMHEDICTLALKNQTSLIILPFHQKWAIDGSIESEDINKRILNRRVLERAPCSVGILIDRSNVRRKPLESTYRVCMIFIGGNDDREALTLAKRAATSSNSHLTVLRLISEEDNGELDWDKMLDSEELKDIKQHSIEEQLTYLEEVVTDGSQTASVVQSLVTDQELFIVGRRHGLDSPQTSGLMEWGEFSELGVLGDLLASKDIDINAVLVIQQQHITG